MLSLCSQMTDRNDFVMRCAFVFGFFVVYLSPFPPFLQTVAEKVLVSHLNMFQQ